MEAHSTDIALQLRKIDFQAGDFTVGSSDCGCLVTGKEDRVFRTDATAGGAALPTVVRLFAQNECGADERFELLRVIDPRYGFASQQAKRRGQRSSDP